MTALWSGANGILIDIFISLHRGKRYYLLVFDQYFLSYDLLKLKYTFQNATFQKVTKYVKKGLTNTFHQNKIKEKMCWCCGSSFPNELEKVLEVFKSIF